MVFESSKTQMAKGRMILTATLSCVCLVYLVSNMSVMNSMTLPATNLHVPPAFLPFVSDESCTGADPAVRDHYHQYYHMDELLPIFKPWTMATHQQQSLAVQAMMQLNVNKVPGDVVECGVWKGGMTMAMIFANMRDNTDRHF
jgi:hypothetical protein